MHLLGAALLFEPLWGENGDHAVQADLYPRSCSSVKAILYSCIVDLTTIQNERDLMVARIR